MKAGQKGERDDTAETDRLTGLDLLVFRIPATVKSCTEKAELTKLTEQNSMNKVESLVSKALANKAGLRQMT